MGVGMSILVGALLVVLPFLALQYWMVRKSQAMIGEAPTFPEGWGHLATGAHTLWFHSPHCGPCRAMERELRPFLEEGRIVEIDVTRAPALGQRLGVMATPTTVALRDGRVVRVEVGVRHRAQLEDLVAPSP